MEDVVVAGMRQKASGQKSLGLLFGRAKTELTSAHSRVTTRHRPHHYPENQSATGAAPPDAQDGANQSPGQFTDMKTRRAGAILQDDVPELVENFDEAQK